MSYNSHHCGGTSGRKISVIQCRFECTHLCTNMYVVCSRCVNMSIGGSIKCVQMEISLTTRSDVFERNSSTTSSFFSAGAIRVVFVDDIIETNAHTHKNITWWVKMRCIAFRLTELKHETCASLDTCVSHWMLNDDTVDELSGWNILFVLLESMLAINGAHVVFFSLVRHTFANNMLLFMCKIFFFRVGCAKNSDESDKRTALGARLQIAMAGRKWEIEQKRHIHIGPTPVPLPVCSVAIAAIIYGCIHKLCGIHQPHARLREPTACNI